MCALEYLLAVGAVRPID